MRFTLGSPAAATSQPAAATAGGQRYPAAGSPSPQPTATSVFTDMSPETARPDGLDGPRLPVRGSRLQTVVMLGLAALALAAAGIAVWYKLTHKPGGSARNGAMVFPEKNLALEAPPSPWVQDGATQALLGSPYIRVYKRENPEAYIAIGARDYSRQDPRPSELRQGLIGPLRKVLVANTLKEEQVRPETRWLGQAVKGFDFRGQLQNGSNVEGEAYAITHKGVAYWFLAWTGENQIFAEQRPVFEDVRNRCRLLDTRADWSPSKPGIVYFKNNVLGYSILDGEGIWKEVSSEEAVKAEDPQADKHLTARVKQTGSDFAWEAEMTALVLDNSGDPLQQVREYLEKRENRDVDNLGKTTFLAHTEDTSYDEPNPVEGNAPYLLLKGTNSKSGMSRLWVISAIKIGDKTVAAVGRCSFATDDRELFERKLVALVRSLRATQ